MVIEVVLTAVVLHAPQARIDRLDDVKEAGVLRVGMFDASPPPGYADTKTGESIELDVDYAQEIVNKPGVKPELCATNLVNRAPPSTSGRIDIVTTNFTTIDERKKQAEFDMPYFASGLQFIAKKGILKQPDDLKKNGIRLGVGKGITQETALCEGRLNARVTAYGDFPLAFTTLRIGAIQISTQDGVRLGTLLAMLPNRSELEISPLVLTREYVGVGIPEGEIKLTVIIDQILQGPEKDGTTGRTYDHWSGPKSAAPLPRDFIIGNTKRA